MRSWKRLLTVLAIATGVFVAMPKPSAAQDPQAAGCLAAIINQTGSANSSVNAEYNHPLEMNHEGRAERSADIVIYSANSGSPQTCFISGNTIDVKFPEVLTSAGSTSYGVNGTAAAAALGNEAPGGALPASAWHVNDPSGLMSVTATVFTTTVSNNAGDGTTGTDVRFNITTGTTLGSTCLPPTAGASCAGSTPYIVLQNLRFDVVPMANGSAVTSPGNPFDAVTSVFGPDDVVTVNEVSIDTSTFDPSLQVGTVRNTIYCYSLHYEDLGDGARFSDPQCADVYRVGFGLEDGVNDYLFTANGGGPGNIDRCPNGTQGCLITSAVWYMTENPYWQYVNPFRIKLSPNRVASDISTTPTDLVIDLETIPYNVTITLPNTLSICDGGGNVGVQWQTSGTPSVTGASSGTSNLIAVYHTVAGDVNDPSPGSPLIVHTGQAAMDANCAGGTLPYPVFGVTIGDPSGIGDVLLRVVFGPSEGPGAFSGDDVNASATPRYMNAITPAEGTPGDLSRGIIDNSLGGPVEYIHLNPTRTYLLYDYVTDKDTWQTGIEVANAGNDAQAFAPEGIENAGEVGALDIWVFPSNGTPFVYTATASNGRNLDASGLLHPGSIWADTLDDILTSSGHSALVGNFDGYLIIVGHFNFGHGAAYLFSGSVSGTSVPALVLGGDSARLGDVTKLPEALKQ